MYHYRYAERGLKFAWIGVVLGPAIGGLVASAYVAGCEVAYLASHQRQSSSLWFLAHLWFLAQLRLLQGGLVAGYIFGSPPAVIANIYLAIRISQRGCVGYFEVIAAALLGTAVAITVILLLTGPSDGWSLVSLMCISAIASGTLCRLLAGRAGLFPSG